jgi:hypothetical protein
MMLEVGKKYKRNTDVVEVKFVDCDGNGWGLSTDDRSTCVILDYGWQEVIDKPDPGEGWRLLHSDEDLEIGDQCYLAFSDPFEDWATAKCSDLKQFPGMFYRRRIAPQYVPYTWEDREELRGRWFRRKDKEPSEFERFVCFFSLIDGHFYINFIRSDELLNECEWLDGSPCGKKVV